MEAYCVRDRAEAEAFCIWTLHVLYLREELYNILYFKGEPYSVLYPLKYKMVLGYPLK